MTLTPKLKRLLDESPTFTVNLRFEPVKEEDFPVFVRHHCWKCGSTYTHLFDRNVPQQEGERFDCVDCGQALWVPPPANEG